MEVGLRLVEDDALAREPRGGREQLGPRHGSPAAREPPRARARCRERPPTSGRCRRSAASRRSRRRARGGPPDEAARSGTATKKSSSCVRASAAVCTSRKPPPPGPVSGLSQIQETPAAAMHASTAFPPARRISAPASAVSGCPAANAPLIAGSVRFGQWPTCRYDGAERASWRLGCRSRARPCSAPGSRQPPRRCSSGSHRRAAISRRTSTSARSSSRHGFTLWDNFWYAGRYAFVGYSVLYYPLAALLGIRLLAVLTIARQRRRVRRAARAGVGICRALGDPRVRGDLGGSADHRRVPVRARHRPRSALAARVPLRSAMDRGRH